MSERETLSARAAPVGVAVEAGADAQAHLSDLTNRPLVALAFDKFADGRSFSYARILRDRRQFRGELRAIGDVLIDEIPLMLRCGFDSFEVTNAPTLHALQAGRLPGSPLHYQPSSAHDEAHEGTRPWLRVTRPSNGLGLRAKREASSSEERSEGDLEGRSRRRERHRQLDASLRASR